MTDPAKDVVEELREMLASFAYAVRREHRGDDGAAVADIVAERRRHVEVEGWTAEHDDAHRNHELAMAAACYAWAGQWHGPHWPWISDFVQRYWPWDRAWWKPTTRRRNLVKAGALIVAEIERLDRASGASRPSPVPSQSQEAANSKLVDETIERCAKVARDHRNRPPAKIRPGLTQSDDDFELMRESIRSEERGEKIASEMIELAIRALKSQGDGNGL